MVDLDRDGRLDVLTGSYDPGDVQLFARRADGTFAAPRALAAVGGEALHVGVASVPSVCDWERDGDLDLVLGNMFGKVFLARNASGGKGLAFAPAVPLVVGDVELDIDSTNAAPCVADWDQDGRADLLLGCGDGRVLFFRNAKAVGEPELAPPVELVPEASDPTAGSRRESPGLRARVCVFDWNEDGRVDLVCGEYGPETGPAPVLSAAEQQSLEAAMAESVELGQRRGELERAALARWLAAQEIPLDKAADHYRRFLDEWNQSAELAPIVARQMQLAETMRRLNPTLVERGRVWVYLRKPRQ